jgi:hypothetical protein
MYTSVCTETIKTKNVKNQCIGKKNVRKKHRKVMSPIEKVENKMFKEKISKMAVYEAQIILI